MRWRIDGWDMLYLPSGVLGMCKGGEEVFGDDAMKLLSALLDSGAKRTWKHPDGSWRDAP